MASTTSEGRRRAASPKRRARTRVPRQARAQQTVEAILQATRELAVRDGFERVTTNAIAKLAGVSIGSVYQYFDGLEAIVDELSTRHVDRLLALIFAEMEAIADEPLEVGVRRMIRLMVEVHRQDPALHRAIQASMPAHCARAHLVEVEERLLLAAVGYLSQRREQIAVDDLERAAFVGIGTIEALTHNAIVSRPELLEGDALIDDLTRMLMGYLEGR